jgi:zinc/manganese transport system substrate-binding protein
MRSGLGWLLIGCLIGACSGAPTGTASTSTLQVIAGQNFWGSIAAQLGGSKVNVQSVVTDPNADPHEYESNTNDARAFATANLVILNGAGYDEWGQKLLDASPSSSRKVLVVAGLLGVKAGDNPHFWYSPDFVLKVADAITADYRSLDSVDASYFDQQRSAFDESLEPYLQRLAEIKQRFAGMPVGSTETVFVYLARYLGLDLISPPAFMQAVSEGNDPPTNTVVEFQDQISSRAIKVLVFNVQTETAVTTNLRMAAIKKGIPVVGISETLHPETATFQEWQVTQLIALENAL